MFNNCFRELETFSVLYINIDYIKNKIFSLKRIVLQNIYSTNNNP